MTDVNVVFEVQHDSETYLETSARLRGISRTRLLKRVMEIVLTDQLILGILDDGDKPSEKTARKPTPRGRPRNMPPKDRLFDAVIVRPKSSSVPQRRRGGIPRYTYGLKSKSPPTKNEMLEQLRQAVLNTGGEVVE